MKITGPTIPFHVARAYGVRPPTPLRRAEPIEASQSISRRPEQIRPERMPSNIDRLISAVVPGRIDFTSDTPQPTSEALPLYRHPADLNAAATNIHAGRTLDVSG